MTNLQPPVGTNALKTATDLIIGDRITAAMLPLRQTGEIVFVRPFALRGERWVFVAYVQPNGFYDSTTYSADSPILLDFAAEQPTGDLHCPGVLAFGPTSRSVCGSSEPHSPHPVSGDVVVRGLLVDQQERHGAEDDRTGEVVGPAIHVSTSGRWTQCRKVVADLSPGERVVSSWSDPSTCMACADEAPF